MHFESFRLSSHKSLNTSGRLPLPYGRIYRYLPFSRFQNTTRNPFVPTLSAIARVLPIESKLLSFSSHRAADKVVPVCSYIRQFTRHLHTAVRTYTTIPLMSHLGNNSVSPHRSTGALLPSPSLSAIPRGTVSSAVKTFGDRQGEENRAPANKAGEEVGNTHTHAVASIAYA